MKTTSASQIISDNQSLKSAKTSFGNPIKTYDDGFGPLFIHRDSMGISGIVRAQTWEDAYSICEDEFFPAGDSDANEELQRIEAMPDGAEKNHAQACWDESYGYRGNGRAEKDGSTSYIYAKDLSGDSLELLTPELLSRLEITLEITSEDDDEKPTIASLDSFTRGYIVAAFWTNDDKAPGGCDYRHTSRPDECFAQLSVEALNAMIDDCARFQDFNSALLAMAGTDEQNGIDFWLTRNGHGAGFWDRGYDSTVGNALTSACKTFGESNLYTGDDGKLYIA